MIKPLVVALREIATGHTDFSDAHEVDMAPPTVVEEVTITMSDMPETDEVAAKPETNDNHSSVGSESEES